ncbi:MAG: hypothetical protein GFH27_549293n310 [Chloroflexi bacterium AL-W]|nr:hypothetical protein [Chloroflexi bacterium AL-N1]NOK67575.1 hypothetical protein [Chloroflexi bacterium AL-N10]NOK75655.1 hypothetical protein [Chloroflexi bacterium AL-N5]NOK82443.1 hypothetical protein [Chloroflexi bacterium AL-W]NOK90288.1 hypothetical protein [Chloroflexi bacterium AL-N15]
MPDHHPQVSVALPVYNGEPFLREAIDSVLAQTFEDFELIITDNASTDATPEICLAYAEADPRVRYYRNLHNIGAAGNYNLTVELAHGQYLRWLAHDDMFASTLLERSVAVLDTHPEVVLVYPRTMIIDQYGKVLRYDDEDLNLRIPNIHQRYQQFHRFARGEINAIFGLLRLSALRETPLIGAFSSSDMILLGEMALRGQFYEVPEYLFLRRDHVHTSVNANWAYSQRAVWFDPANAGRLQMTRWRWLQEFWQSIERVPMERSERLHCYFQLARWGIHPRNAAGLAMDVLQAAMWPFAKDLDMRYRLFGFH